jgi:hypothetical protein
MIELTRRESGKLAASDAAAEALLGVAAHGKSRSPVRDSPDSPAAQADESFPDQSLANKFGIGVLVNSQTGAYSVKYQGQSWLGTGILSVLAGGRWYRSGGIRFFEQDGNLSVRGTKLGSGRDNLGSYDSIDLYWNTSGLGVDLITGFRLYRENPYLVFTQTFPAGFRHYASGDWTTPSVTFPQFVMSNWDDLSDLHVWTSGGMWTYGLGFGDASGTQGTVDFLLLADANCHTMILSPFSNYLVATQQSLPLARRDRISKGSINCGIEGLASELPPGFEHSHIIVVGDGVRNTFDKWGGALLQKGAKEAPSKYQDDTLKYLVYMDDAGAYYYEHDFSEQGYATYEDIILAIEREARRHDLHIGAYHIMDDPQQQDRQNGLFEPRKDLFPHGLTWLHQQLGKPLQLYMMWLRADSPYCKKYPYWRTDPGEIPMGSMGAVFYSLDYWRYTAEKIASWGGILLQHDYLSTYEGDQVMMSRLDRMNRYFRNMAKALAEKGIDIQYCMQLPRNIMQSSENPIMVSLQGSEDHHVTSAEPGWNYTKLVYALFGRDHGDHGDPFFWRHLIFTSAFYGALAIWPSRDNIQTIADPNAYEDTLIANLLGGSIQLGHRIGECNFELLRRTYREGDGLILKADRPISPLDRCYVDGGVVGYTESQRNGRTWYYVLSLPAAGFLPSFSPSDLGVKGKWVVYNHDTRIASIRDTFSSINLQREAKHEYFVVAPLLENGMAVIGDVEKFVTMADMRVSSVEASPEGIGLEVISNEGHSPIIVGYAASRPGGVQAGETVLGEVSSLDRLKMATSGWFWDYQTRLWHVKVSFAGASEMEKRSFRIRRPLSHGGT